MVFQQLSCKLSPSGNAMIPADELTFQVKGKKKKNGTSIRLENNC